MGVGWGWGGGGGISDQSTALFVRVLNKGGFFGLLVSN